MSLIPRMFSHWWEALDRPHRVFDQHFGQGLHPDHFFNPAIFDRRFPYPYQRPWAEFLREGEGGLSVVKADKDKFQVGLDVQQFKPDEISIKVKDKCVIVEGKHEEQQDEHGFVSRQFVRKYLVPEQCDPEQVTSTLSSDGILTITAPRKQEAIEDKPEKTISIEHTGKPAIEEEKKK